MTAGDLAASPVWMVDPARRAADAAEVLSARGFDVAGVGIETPTHFVQTEAIRGRVGKVKRYAHPILASDCVTNDLPLTSLLEILERQPYVFVVRGGGIGGIVTRADLQSPLVGLAVLGYVLRVERSLALLVRAELGDHWLAELSEERRRNVEAEYERRRSENTDVGLDACLYFADWLKLAKRCPRLRSSLELTSNSGFDRAFGSFDKLRNTLAHGRSLLDGSEPLAALSRIRRLRTLSTRLDLLAEDLDPLWDVYAETTLSVRVPSGRRRKLTGPQAASTFPFSGAVHVLTAWNPGSIQRSATANRVANDNLTEFVRRHGHEFERCDGSSPNLAWVEEGLLVHGMSRERAAEVGALFGQAAVFEVNSDELRIVRCDDASVVRAITRRPSR